MKLGAAAWDVVFSSIRKALKWPPRPKGQFNPDVECK